MTNGTNLENIEKMEKFEEINQETNLEVKESYLNGGMGTNTENSESIAKLGKSIGLPHAFVLTIGILIGSGVFVSPSLVMLQTNDAGLSLIIWTVGGFIAIFGSLCFCELGCAIKRAGGIYVYVYEAYGKLPAFLSCWALVFIAYPACIGGNAFISGIFILKPFDDYIDDIWYTKLVACIIILISGSINLWSIEVLKKLQSCLTFLQVVGISMIVVVGIWKMIEGNTENIQNAFQNSKNSYGQVGIMGAALYNCLWSYEGWFTIPSISEEMKNVKKNLLFCSTGGVLFVLICYILVNISLLSTLTPEEIAASPAVAVTFLEETLGTKAKYVISTIVGLSCWGSCNGLILTASRVVLAAGRNGQFPTLFSMIHKKRRTPVPAVLLFILLNLTILIAGGSTLDFFIQLYVFTMWLNYTVSILGIMVLRYRSPELKRPFKVPLLIAVAMTFVSIFVLTLAFIIDPKHPIVALSMISIGLPVYYFFFHLNLKYPKWIAKGSLIFVEWITKKCNLAPCVYDQK